jgi:hypothetical protein
MGDCQSVFSPPSLTSSRTQLSTRAAAQPSVHAFVVIAHARATEKQRPHPLASRSGTL